MPYLFQYLLKFSLSLALVFMFYQFVLRPLTFYQWNRFYLLIYAFGCFFIPCINITAWLNSTAAVESKLVRSIPVVESLTAHISSRQMQSGQTPVYNYWNLGLLILVAGALFMASRLTIQYVSLRKMKHASKLLIEHGIRLYDVSHAISPFSFGKGVYINCRLHTDDELQKIIAHEMVHVRQKHSVDIMLIELLCITNWFNPFAWLMRKAVRQNLEFIADDNVLRNGQDARQYQYLLLKVVGIPQYAIAPNFNISSLKKRIAMINKIKSAKVHLVKFLFIVPMLALMLLAFREKMNTQKKQLYLTYAGIVINADNYKPLKNVVVRESNTGSEMVTGENGYFKFRVPVTNPEASLSLIVSQEKMVKHRENIKWVEFQPEGSETFVGCISVQDGLPDGRCDNCFSLYEMLNGKDGSNVPDVSFETVRKNIDVTISTWKDLKLLQSSSKPIIKTENRIYFRSIDEEILVTRGEPLVFLNGILSSYESVNTALNVNQVTKINSLTKDDAYRKYGKNEEAVELFTVAQSATDTVPPPPPPPPPTQPVGPIQYARGKDSVSAPASPAPPQTPEPRPAVAPKPNVQSISVNRQGVKPVVRVKSKDGTIKKYDFNKPGEQAAYEKEIGYPPVSPALPADPVQPVKAISPQVSVKTAVNVDPVYVVDGVTVSARNLHVTDPVINVQIKALMEQNAVISGDTAAPAAIIVTAKDHDGRDITALAEKITINNFEVFKGVIILNGKEITKEALQNIAGDSIRIVSVLKGSAAEALYKEKGKNGVIIITTKPAQ